MKIQLTLLLSWFVLLVMGQEQPTEFITDRKETIYESLLPVPPVERWEKRLGITSQGLVQAGDVKLWVEQQGSGVPLLLMCGGPGTSYHYFHPHFQPAKEFSRVIYFDLRGVGRSEYNPGTGYTLAQAVEDVENLRKALKIDKWYVLASSFAGSVAQLYAIRYPERLYGIILSGSTVPMSIDVGLGKRQFDYMTEREKKRVTEIYTIDDVRQIPAHTDRITPDMQKSMIFNAFMNGDWKRRHYHKITEEDMAHYATYEFVHDKNYYVKMVEDERKYDLKGVFQNCPIPFLLMDGKYDMAFLEEKSEILKQQFGNSRLVVIDKAGHVPFEDNPELYFEEVRKFMEANTAKKVDAIEWKKQTATKKIYFDPPTRK